MLGKHLSYLVSPITHKILQYDIDALCTFDKSERYPIINGVPIFLTDNSAPIWHREVIEVLLWEYPDKINELYSKINYETSTVDLYIEYISNILKDKDGIISAIESYSRERPNKWLIKNFDGVIPRDELDTFNKRKAENYAIKTVMSTRNGGRAPWAEYLPKYTNQIHSNDPNVILEFSTGAGFGTAAVADEKPSDCIMFTIDISYGCHGNTIGIAHYLGIQDSLFPVCANFWHCPFPNQSVDIACSNFGLDESRDINTTIMEISRILKKGGRFVNVSRFDATIRQYNLFEPFGFSKDETIKLFKHARLYSDIDDLISICDKNGLVLNDRIDFQSIDSPVKNIEITSYVRS